MVNILLKIIRMFKMNTFIIIAMLLTTVYPCAVCYGAPDHPVTQGMNNAVMFLLFVVAFVLSCIGASMYVLIKRAKALEIKRSDK
tara:strand:- start:210 stop:464 length:255 start_codon:yes stop_codon:yes gene_type:complete